MDNLIETIERFLTYSDEKLEELSEKNQNLKQLEQDSFES